MKNLCNVCCLHSLCGWKAQLGMDKRERYPRGKGPRVIPPTPLPRSGHFLSDPCPPAFFLLQTVCSLRGRLSGPSSNPPLPHTQKNYIIYQHWLTSGTNLCTGHCLVSVCCFFMERGNRCGVIYGTIILEIDF